MKLICHIVVPLDCIIYLSFAFEQVRKEKSIYHTLNMLSIDVTRKCLVAEGWCPVSAKPQVCSCAIIISGLEILCYNVASHLDFLWLCWVGCLQIQDALHRAAFDSNSQVASIFQVLHTKDLPPTYFKTNKFTSAYQDIVDAYGWESYFLILTVQMRADLIS